MTEWGEIIRRAWGVLSTPAEQELSSYPVDLMFAGAPVRLALDRRGHRHLLVPSGQEKVSPDQRLHVLTMSQGTYAFGAVADPYLDIQCGDPELNPEFDEVVLDVLACIGDSSTPAAAAAQTISRWRRLFRASLRKSLSEQQRLGLFAELALLEELLDVDGSLSPIVWTGPDRLPHDLELEHACIEVKGLGNTSEGVTVHGLDQLESHDEKPLYLILVKVVSEETGRTINELANDLKARFADGAGFISQLCKSGWAADDHLAAVTPYAVQSVSVVLVTGETPRLVHASLVSDLPPGVRDVRYVVELSGLLGLSDVMTFTELARRILK